MNIRRINTVLLHTWYHFTHSMETWVDLFWNSAVQMVVFVLIAASFAGEGSDVSRHSIIIGMIFWNIIWVGQYALCVGALWEIWSRSFSSLFITPLTLNEFLIGQMISGTAKSLASVVLAAVIGWALSGFSVLSLSWMLPVYYLVLLIYSWSVGFIVLSLIFRYGTDVQSLSWALVFLVQPIGAVFYPVNVLPVAVRWVAYLFPTTYIFETIREQLATSRVAWADIATGATMSLVYLVISYWVLMRTHRQAKISGAFARMES